MAGAKKRIEHDEVVRRFAARLRQVRTGRGMTQAELAARAGVSVAYVGRLERGRAAPGIDLVARLAHALGATPGSLLPDGPPADGPAVLRTQARRLFDGLLKSDDEATLSLLAQFLAKLAESDASGR
jgi:transcriptional regulator with XRE-family HTH domain